MKECRKALDVVVVGGGQAGLAVGYYLRRTGLSFEILDREAGPGGAWRYGWDSLRLFSPSLWSSLPGMPMPGGVDRYPSRDEVLKYLAMYEERYSLPVRRPTLVETVSRGADALYVDADAGRWSARVVVSTTGTWSHPFIPTLTGQGGFRGEQLHSAHYKSPTYYRGKRVLVVGGGNSGAQIMAEVSRVSRATWITSEEPRFLSADVDGRALFEQASHHHEYEQGGQRTESYDVRRLDLSDIVMVPSVRDAKDRGALESVRPFRRFTRECVVWTDGRLEPIDVVIWCTGFRPSLDHLSSLGIVDENGSVLMEGTRSVEEPRLRMIGYANWTGYASATLVGIGRIARSTVHEIARELATH